MKLFRMVIATSFLSSVLCRGIAASDIKLRTLDESETGLNKIMQTWHDEELERQGGKFKGHGWWPWGLRAFDFDNDGDLDLTPSHHGQPRSIILKSLFKESGKLQFVNVTRELGVESRDLPGSDDRPWIWDMDGDGFLDIGGFSDESPPASFLNKGGKKFVPIVDFTFSPLSHPREIVDLNGDGYLDVDGGKSGQWFFVPESATYKRDKQPRFSYLDQLPKEIRDELADLKKKKNNRFFRPVVMTHSVIGYDTLGYSPNPIDLNADGLGDVVVSGSGGYGGDYLGRYLLANKAGEFIESSATLGLPASGAPIWIDDLTGDRFPEILIVGKETGGVYVHDGKKGYARKDNALSEFLTKRGPYLLRAFRVDLDNDSDWDLVLSNPRYGREEIFENKGDGNFVLIQKASGWDANPVVIADMNNDGRMDVVIGGPGGHQSRDIKILLNETPNSGNYCKVFPKMKSPNPFAVGAVIEVYRSGESTTGRPILIEKAHSDGTPVHVGIGVATECELRVTFPGGKVVTGNVSANTTVVVDVETGTIYPR